MTVAVDDTPTPARRRRRTFAAQIGSAPVGELGGSDTIAEGLVDPYEDTPELQWPLNLRVFDQMRRQDAQARALIRAITLPQLGTKWTLMGKQVDPRVMAVTTRELGLELDDDGRRRHRPVGVNFDVFLRHALLHLVFGFMPMEVVAALGPPDGDETGMPPTMAHLYRLAPRMPRQVSRLVVSDTGELLGIEQMVMRYAQAPFGQVNDLYQPTDPQVQRYGNSGIRPIPADRLAYFVNEQEGGDWTGQSIFRASFKHWLIKDALIRVGAMAVDRTGMGVPVVTYPEGTPANRRKALDIASAVRAGDDSGVALEAGWSFSLQGVQGTVSNALEWVTYHDQSMSRAALAMFLDLGHDGGLGHGSLGDTFLDYFMLSQRAVMRYLEEIITEQVIRPFCRWNFGPDEPYPTISADDISMQEAPTARALQSLANAGLLLPDEAARTEARRRFGMPPEPADAGSTSTPGDNGFVGELGRTARGAAALARAAMQLTNAGFDRAAVAKALGLPPMPAEKAPAAAPIVHETDSAVPAPGVPGMPTQAVQVPPSGDRPLQPGAAQPTALDVARRRRLAQQARPTAMSEEWDKPEPDVMLAASSVTFDAETAVIRRNRSSATARAAHQFRPGRWSNRRGQPRCLTCGSQPVRVDDGIAPCTGLGDPDAELAEAPGPTTAEKENTRIEAGKKTAKAHRKHMFRPSRFPGPDGHARCRLCGGAITHTYRKGGYTMCPGIGQPMPTSEPAKLSEQPELERLLDLVEQELLSDEPDTERVAELLDQAKQHGY